MDRLHQFHEWCCRLTPEKLKLTPLLPNPELGRAPLPHQAKPHTFASLEEYKETFLHLFYKEARSQLEKSWQAESRKSLPAQLVGVTSEPPFKVLSIACGEVKAFAHHDLLCLSLPPTLGEKQVRVLGVAQSFESLHVKVVGQMASVLLNHKEFRVEKVASLPTLQRQFVAIQSVGTSFLLQALLNPAQCRKVDPVYFRIPRPLKEQLYKKFNKSQLAAIKQALKKDGITLIQGPPGTGKTVTLIGTLSVILHARQARARRLGLSREESIRIQRKKTSQLFEGIDWRDQLFAENDFQLEQFELRGRKTYFPKAAVTDRVIKLDSRKQESQRPARVLICGPSNGSVDQIIRRVESQGLIDDKGQQVNPLVVRIGQNFNSDTQKYSLDFLCEQEMLRLGLSKSQEFRVKQRIISGSQLVCTTLNSAGSYVLANSGLKFDTVVIDEACQSVEPSSLIPLIYGCRRLILIGDPSQLPSTTFSRQAAELGYDLSLFERLMSCGLKVVTLTEQYRMHPSIVDLISRQFYSSKISSAANILDLLPKGKKTIFFRPLMFLHVDKSAEQFHKESYRNRRQAGVVKLLAQLLEQESGLPVSVITPYSGQVAQLNKIMKTCQVKTVDSFQGRQKEAIIFNTVRASRVIEKGKERPSRGGIGFLKDSRRLNVGLSRGRSFCVIVGDGSKLVLDEMWARMLEQVVGSGGCFRLGEGKDVLKGAKQVNCLDQFR